MKNKILSIFSAFTLLLGVNACQSPEDFNASDAGKGLTSFTASFLNDDRDENVFNAEIDYTNHVVNVVFPYNYPRLSDDVLTTDKLKEVKVNASLDNNATIAPQLLLMDLTKENSFELTTPVGAKFVYKVVAEIRKSAECAITSFSLPSKNITGIINEEAKTITLISVDNIGSALAEISISHGATITPNPATTELNYDQSQKITVTAQNGTTQAVYTVVKGVPGKVASGMRPKSAKILWTRKLADVGAQKALNMTTGLAVMGDYVLINERNSANAVYLNAKTGDVEGHVNIPFAGSLTNFYTTADDDGNALITNLTANTANPDFILWRLDGVTGTPYKYIEYPTKSAMGRKVSIIGSLNKDAIITAPIYSTAGQFARWEVKNGALVSATPTIVTAAGLGSWGTNADIIYTNPSDVRSNYIGAFYTTPRSACLFDGATNSILSKGPEISSNWVQNAVDYIQFNKLGYAITNSVNSFSWGSDDCLYMYDLGGNALDNQAIDFSAAGLNINGNYGAKALGAVNGNATSDVAFKVSSDGFYLYIYFMFTNGYVGCIQCDCIDM